MPQEDTSIILMSCGIALIFTFLYRVHHHPEILQDMVRSARSYKRMVLGGSAEPPPKYNFYEIPPQELDKTSKALSLYDSSVIDTFQPVQFGFNPDFYFYNKMPKCGSTTLKVLLKELALKNKFAQYVVLMGTKTSRDDTEEMLVNDIWGEYEKAKQSPFIAVKHETILNFTKFGKAQPTTFNIVRDPIDRFVSNYYFCRYGSISMPNYRCRPYPEDKRLMLVDDFFTTGHGKLGEFSDTHYVSWLCGYDPLCKKSISKTDKDKPAVYSYTKNLIMNDYLVLGILEEFKKTLTLFEVMMPEIFTGALETVKDEKVTSAAAAMKTNKKAGLSNETRVFLEQNQFSYDMDLYRFIKAKFYKQYAYMVGN